MLALDLIRKMDTSTFELNRKQLQKYSFRERGTFKWHRNYAMAILSFFKLREERVNHLLKIILAKSFLVVNIDQNYSNWSKETHQSRYKIFGLIRELKTQISDNVDELFHKLKYKHFYIYVLEDISEKYTFRTKRILRLSWRNSTCKAVYDMCLIIHLIAVRFVRFVNELKIWKNDKIIVALV